MIDGWSLVRFLHVTAAVLWVGGQLTLSLVVRRAAAETLEGDHRRRFFAAAGRRFGRIATVVLIPVLLSTGLALTSHRGVSLGALALPGYGATLGTKIILAFVSFGLAATHGIIAARGNATASRTFGVAGGIVSVVVVLFATALVP